MLIKNPKEIKKVITHDNCSDGLACALLLKPCLAPDTPIVFMQYGTKEYHEMRVEPNVLFADFSPPIELAKGFADAGGWILDHHIGAKATVELFGDRGVFADENLEPGMSGAGLVLLNVWRESLYLTRQAHFARLDVARQADFARLVGIRDTWQRNVPDWKQALILHQVLRFFPRDWLLSLGLDTFFDDWGRYMKLGESLLKKHQEEVEKAAENGQEEIIIIDGRKRRVIFIPDTHLTSDVAEYLEDKVDLVVGFSWKMEDGRSKMVFSTRSHTDFNCADFCKANGGGGHTKAAGCSIEIPEYYLLEFDKLVEQFKKTL